MTVLTLKTFAIKLGFNRVSNPIFRRLLREWEIDGSVHLYQGGYLGHSTAHPKKIEFHKELNAYVAQAKAIPQPPEFHLYAFEPMLNVKGLKIVSGQTGHRCSSCDDCFFREAYISSSVFFTLKICKKCIQKLCEEGILVINVPFKRLGTITVTIKRDE